MGRDRKNEQGGEHFTKLVRNTMETPAWRALSPTAQALYPWLKLEWRGPQANNNGKIRLSVRQASERLGGECQHCRACLPRLAGKGLFGGHEARLLGHCGAGDLPGIRTNRNRPAKRGEARRAAAV